MLERQIYDGGRREGERGVSGLFEGCRAVEV